MGVLASQQLGTSVVTKVFYNKDNSYYKICSNTGEDKTCTDQFGFDLVNEDHLNYFNYDYTTEVLSCQ
jgi:hypothetical protein